MKNFRLDDESGNQEALFSWAGYNICLLYTSGCQFCTTGCKRTGCIFCLFGILQDRDRILKLEKEDKRLADYVLGGGEYDKEGMWIPTNKGLGYMKVLDFLNENGLEIPY